MLSAERRNLILKQVQEEKKVVVSQLSRTFDVSEETIRRDLEKLEEEGYVVKSYGGAILKEDIGRDLPFNVRYRMNPEGKALIARLAAEEIRDNDYIFMDASSTTIFLSQALRKKEFEKLTVITNSIENAVILGSHPGCEIVLSGGSLRSESMSLMGPKALDFISAYHVSKAFISCRGIDLNHGVTEGSDEIAGIKQAVIKNADNIYLLADKDKLDQVSFAKTCELGKIHTLITDERPNENWETTLYERNIRLICPEETQA
ncbi:MAG: DeoR/GlpR family DNA-binding transcription regulator [Lachnospiraceae bacterium]|nr:DeoR/GlpR family DNA-binding transcription regulator [Lachnospiraceae bacterium]